MDYLYNLEFRAGRVSFVLFFCTMPKIRYGTYENYHNNPSAVESVCHSVFNRVST